MSHRHGKRNLVSPTASVSRRDLFSPDNILTNFSIWTARVHCSLAQTTWNLFIIGKLLMPGTYLHLSNSFFHSCLVLAILNFAKKSCCKLFNIADMPPTGRSLYHCRAVPDSTYLIPATLVASLWNLSLCKNNHYLNLVKYSSISTSGLSPE